MKISLFKLKKNRRYNYTPRYFRGKELENIYDFNSKFSKFRDNFNKNDFGKSWDEERQKMRTRSNSKISSRLLIILIVLFLIFSYLLDFDFTIFTKKIYV